MDFDPNAISKSDTLFGLPHSREEAKLVILPVPWDVTTSYKTGAAKGPEAIRKASLQVDLYHQHVQRPWEPGIYMLVNPGFIESMNLDFRPVAEMVMNGTRAGFRETVNAACLEVNKYVYDRSVSLMREGKIVGILGGDHSVPFGAYQAAAEIFGGFGILHFDAHADLREAFEGLTYSHASIMHNAWSKIPQVHFLVQVGIRDTCEAEMEFVRKSQLEGRGGFVHQFTDDLLHDHRFDWGGHEAAGWHLPPKVWISFDIDALDPSLCPNTGTPVPGGLSIHMARDIIRAVSQRATIIGFDLVEVAPDPEGRNDWDANVGARVLYDLCAYTLASQKLCKMEGR